MKTIAINIRVSDDLKNLIDLKAEDENLSFSQVARQILEDFFQQSEESETEIISSEDKEYETLQKIEEVLLEENENIIYTTRFIQLICWVYDQKSDKRKWHNEASYEAFKNTIIELNGAKQIEDGLKDEFNKILAELIQRKGSFFYAFEFATTIGFKQFNYDKLNELVYKKLDVEV